jgi:hypothetical protein
MGSAGCAWQGLDLLHGISQRQHVAWCLLLMASSAGVHADCSSTGKREGQEKMFTAFWLLLIW